MLEPDSRVVLLDQLRPPVGYRLEAAVATTFTLHLPTALVAPLALASYEMRTRPEPIAALEAVRSCADKVDIFCQAGQIAVPAQASDLMAFLEPMVHPLRPPRPGFLFHPKIWFLHYVSVDQPDAYRLLCSSRNLVDSHAWDAVVTLDGIAGRRTKAANRPLAALLRHLPQWGVNPLPDERRVRLDDLADRASRVEWALPEHVSDVGFHAFGVPRVAPDPDFSGYRHLVVSPFLNEAGLDRVTGGNSRDVALVSRVEAVSALPESIRLSRPGDVAIFVLDPLAGLREQDDENHNEPDDQAAAEAELAGLHAKITIAERNRGETHVFIGSANATSSAYGGNVEFLVELTGRSKDIGVGTLVNQDAPLRRLLQAYSPDEAMSAPDDEEALHRLENLVRVLAQVPFYLTVEAADDAYSLHLTSAESLRFPRGHEVRLGLLTRPGVTALHATAGPCRDIFSEVSLVEISPFVTMRVSDPTGLTVSTVVHAPLTNDPPGRLDEVLASQVNTTEKFLRFLALLLGLSDPAELWKPSGEGAGDGQWAGAFRGGTGVFELVLRALADRPDSLADLDRLVQRLCATEAGRSILPAGFEELWAAVNRARAALDEAS